MRSREARLPRESQIVESGKVFCPRAREERSVELCGECSRLSEVIARDDGVIAGVRCIPAKWLPPM